MSQRRLFLRVGALVIGSIGLFIGLLLLLTGDRWHTGARYETYFRESVQGLEVGAPVKYRGVTLGHVSTVGLVSAEYGASVDEQVMDPTYRLIVVRFKIDPRRVGKLPETAQAVKLGLRAKLANQGLTGVMYLELDFLAPDLYPTQAVPWTPEDDYIPSVPSTFAQVQDQVIALLHKFGALDLARITRNVDGLITDLRGELASGDLHATIVQGRDALADLRARLDQADLPALSAQLRHAGAALEQLAQGAPTRDAVAQARATLSRLPALVDRLSDVAGRADAGVSDVQAALLPILDDVRAAVQNLREASEAIRRDPGSLILQAPPPRVKMR